MDQILGVNFFVKKGFSFEETIRKEVVNQNERHTKSTKDFEGHFWSKKYTTWTKAPKGPQSRINREVYEGMLVLGRNLNETIVIDGKIFIKIVRGKLGNGLKVAIEAPRDVSIVRGELFPGIEEMEAKWARALGPEQ